MPPVCNFGAQRFHFPERTSDAFKVQLNMRQVVTILKHGHIHVVVGSGTHAYVVNCTVYPFSIQVMYVRTDLFCRNSGSNLRDDVQGNQHFKRRRIITGPYTTWSSHSGPPYRRKELNAYEELGWKAFFFNISKRGYRTNLYSWPYLSTYNDTGSILHIC